MLKIKYLLLLIGLIFSVQSYSQVKFGITAGGNVCNMKFDIDNKYGEEPYNIAKMGHHFGVITDFTLVKNALSLQPALLYSNKGYSIDKEKILKGLEEFHIITDNYEGYARLNYNYIELPIHLVYKIKGFQILAGPYFAIGVGGKIKENYSYENVGNPDFDSIIVVDFTKKLKPIYSAIDDKTLSNLISNEDIYDIYWAYDCGMDIGFGYQLKSILFSAGYSFGLVNMTPRFEVRSNQVPDDYTQKVVQKNRVFSFSVSYFFN